MTILAKHRVISKTFSVNDGIITRISNCTVHLVLFAMLVFAIGMTIQISNEIYQRILSAEEIAKSVKTPKDPPPSTGVKDERPRKVVQGVSAVEEEDASIDGSKKYLPEIKQEINEVSTGAKVEENDGNLYIDCFP